MPTFQQKTRCLFLYFTCIFSTINISAQETVSFTITNGFEIRCAADSMIEVTISPNLNDNYNSIQINWGDGEIETIMPNESLNRSHTYSTFSFLNPQNCSYNCAINPLINGYCFNILVTAQYENIPDENNAKIITYKIPPRADFDPNNTTICVGDEVCFENKTCPDNDDDMVYSWNFDNGITSSAVDTCITYLTAGTYNITLTATNICDTDTKIKTITVINLPTLNVTFNETNVPSNTDTVAYTPYTVTFTNNSLNGISYHWGITHNGSEIFDSIAPNPTPLEYTLGTPGTYIVTMELNSNCGSLIWEQTFTILEPLVGGTITGTIQTLNNIAIPDVFVRLAINGEIQWETLTDSLGVYRFEDLPFGENYEITPYLNEYSGNNVSLVDLTIMRHHNFLAGNNTLLDSPYKLIAADINGDDTIDLTDLNNSMHLLAYKEMPSTVTNTLWRFVPTDYIFGNPLIPWIPMFPESRIIPILDGDNLTNHFIGIQIGDVN